MSDSLDREQILSRLHELESEHRDLDDVIIKLAGESFVNQFQIRRLKKRKLLIKDRIERLKSLLIPDLNA
ncbi:MAG: YdcH family protein [Methylococcales bacterium]